ncbi:MAG: hypothetical protein Q9214_002897, partial [Letrouitia sp. 1 TL-2023]
LRSDRTRTMLPGPTISTSFSCQLSNTLIACPLPSPAPTLECICERPDGCGLRAREDATEVWEECAMPLYL